MTGTPAESLQDQDKQCLAVHSITNARSTGEIGGLVRFGQVLRSAKMEVFCEVAAGVGEPDSLVSPLDWQTWS